MINAKYSRVLPLVVLVPLVLPLAATAGNLEALPPRVASIAVVWVGHSLVGTKAMTEAGPVDLMSLVASFARSRGLGHKALDHTFSGASLSALWRGRAHSYARDVGAMVPRREMRERDAGSFDTLVMTAALPLQAQIEKEFSAYYGRKFYCAVKRANPSARVFLYESWINLNGSDPCAGYPPLDRFD